jgi:hypothetical protein
MKKIIYILIMALTFPLLLISCFKEDFTKDPVVSDIKMYMTDKNGKDSLITEIFKGKKVKIAVNTDANIVAIWPSGVRTIMKKKNSTVDSTDLFGHPVLTASNCYSDYGLVKAQGLATTQMTGGWYAFYTYTAAGSFNLTIVATNHGYNSPELRRIIYDAGNITVN